MMWRFVLAGWLVGGGALALDEVALTWGPHRDLSGAAKDGGVIEITLGEGHPHFWTGVVGAAFDVQRHRIFELEYFAPGGVDSAVLRFRVADGSMVVVGQQNVPLAETWQPLVFDLGAVEEKPAAGHPEMRFHLVLNGKAGSVLQIRNMRLRESNAEEQKEQGQRERVKMERETDAAAILNYFRESPAARIETVHLGVEQITVIGQTPVAASLRGFGPEWASHQAPKEGAALAEIAAGRFRVQVPRRDPSGHEDRALWRWRLIDESGQWVSAAVWPTVEGPAVGRKLAEEAVSHPKGIGGVPDIAGPDHPIFELGVGHATINVVVNALLRDTPAPGFTPWQHGGRTYFVNEGFLNRKDTTLRHLHQKGIRVTCILLVGNHRHADGRPHTLLTHPEAEARGIYSMPNLTSAEGARMYEAVIHLLAERYSREDAEHGRIHNWVMHNEIDQAGTWTNMGDQPLARYLESYLRSARIMHHTARLFDPRARVFVSLTHHWTKRSSGTGTYGVRDLLELFAEMARVEGDFPWGVAYHPYPRDLRNPDTWNDQDVTEAFDTPYITPRNIEVLPAFLGQERFLFKGQRRGLLLSEQGFNTPTLSEQDQRRQVAGLIYMFRKLRDLPEVEAYHLHRFQDMPEAEGGLRLGIMTETGERKLGWHAYRAIGTPEEEPFSRMADEVIGEPGKPASEN